MDATRRDFYRQAPLLWRQLGVLALVALLLMWLVQHAPWRWFELLGVGLLWLCAGAVFFVAARLSTHHHPAISVFTDRIWYRGFREQVVMLRAVRDAQHLHKRIAGMPWHWIELSLLQPLQPDAEVPAERVRIPLDAIDVDGDELLALIRERAAEQRQPASPAH